MRHARHDELVGWGFSLRLRVRAGANAAPSKPRAIDSGAAERRAPNEIFMECFLHFCKVRLINEPLLDTSSGAGSGREGNGRRTSCMRTNRHARQQKHDNDRDEQRRSRIDERETDIGRRRARAEIG